MKSDWNTAKSKLQGSLKEAGAKLRSGLEDLKSLGKADPAQVIIAFNVECFRNGRGSCSPGSRRATRATFGRVLCTRHRNSSWVTSHHPSDFKMSARLSNWCASAVQLREIFASTADRRAEFLGLVRGVSIFRSIGSALFDRKHFGLRAAIGPLVLRATPCSFAIPIFPAYGAPSARYLTRNHRPSIRGHLAETSKYLARYHIPIAAKAA